MEKTRKTHKFKTAAVIAAACVMLLSGTTAAYAADLGGIQRTLQLWVHGDQTEATIQLDGQGHYDLEYAGSEGNTVRQSGGGVAIAPDGSTAPVSEEDLLAELMAPDVCYEEDGSVWLYWFDQKLDITDKFENGICYAKLVNGEDTLYLTIKYQDGYASNPSRYIAPSSFN